MEVAKTMILHGNHLVNQSVASCQLNSNCAVIKEAIPGSANQLQAAFRGSEDDGAFAAFIDSISAVGHPYCSLPTNALTGSLWFSRYCNCMYFE